MLVKTNLLKSYNIKLYILLWWTISQLILEADQWMSCPVLQMKTTFGIEVSGISNMAHN